MNIENLIRKMPLWLKIFGVLYITTVITGTFTFTHFISETINTILGLWITGYVIYKVFGSMVNSSGRHYSLPLIPQQYTGNHNDDTRIQAERETAYRKAQEDTERAAAKYRDAEHAAWKAQQEATQREIDNNWSKF